MTSLNKKETQDLKITSKEYKQYAENLYNIFGITIPSQQEVTRDFVSNSRLAEALQYTPDQFTADKREEAGIAKFSASFIWEQAKQNEKKKEIPERETPPIIKQKEKKQTPRVIKEKKIAEPVPQEALPKEKTIPETESITQSPSPTTIEVPEITLTDTKPEQEEIKEEVRIPEEVEKIEHEDLAILEENVKALTFSISKNYEEKLNALSVLDALLKKHISKQSYKIFRTAYDNSKTQQLSLQKISVDIIKAGKGTVFHKTIAEAKANMNI